MVKLADAAVSKAAAFGRGDSSSSTGTKNTQPW